MIHLESHCSVEQQRQVATILRHVLREHLYIHKDNSPKEPSQMSPMELRGKILIMVRELFLYMPAGKLNEIVCVCDFGRVRNCLRIARRRAAR